MTYSAHPTEITAIQAALRNAQVQAYQHVLKAGESTNHDDSAYAMVEGRPPLTDLSRHPYDGIPTIHGAHASGAYQYLGTTWASYRERYTASFASIYGKPLDFSKEAQDFVCAADLCEHGVIGAISNGDLATANAKLANEWISLPRMGLARAQEVFQQFGGVIDAVSSGTSTMTDQTASAGPDANAIIQGLAGIAASFIPGGSVALPLVQGLIKQFDPQATHELNKAITKYPALADGIMGAVAAATNQSAVAMQDPATAATAVATVQADPGKLALVRAAAMSQLDTVKALLPDLMAIDAAANAARIAGADAASRRNLRDRWDMTPTLVVVGCGLMVLLIVGITAAIGYQSVTGDHKIDSGLLGVAGPLLMAAVLVFREMYAYRFDSTPNSAAKDAVMGQALLQSTSK